MDPRRHHEPPPGHTGGACLCRPPPAADTAPATAPKPAVTRAGLAPRPTPDSAGALRYSGRLPCRWLNSRKLICRPFAPEDPSDAQRPILVWHAADLAMLPFDRHKYRHIARHIRRHQLLVRLTAPEHLRRVFQGRLGVKATPGFSAVRRQERVVAGVLDQREVPVNVSPYISGSGFRGASDEPGDVPISHISLRHAPDPFRSYPG